MLIQHDPWELINELSSFFDGSSKRLVRDDSRVESSRWMPAVDIKEDTDEFKLFVDVPGVDAKQIEISMENNILIIKGYKEEIKKEEKNSYYRKERSKGIFYRRFTLPDTADSEQISAKTKQGVLEITIGKKKAAKVRKIEIQSEGINSDTLDK